MRDLFRLPQIRFATFVALLMAALMLVASARRAGGQQVQGALSLGGGVATDQRGVRSSAATLSPSVLILPDPRLSVGLSATATRFQTRDWSAGASASAGTRLPLDGPLAIAASALASATTTSFQTRYLTADATATVEVAVRGVTLFGGARAAQGNTSVPVSASPATPLGAPPGATRTVATTRTSVGPVYGALLRLPTDDPTVGGTLGYREERARADGVRVLDRVLSARWSTGSVVLDAAFGARDATDERVQFGSAGATIAITQSIAVQGAVGSYPSSRLLATAGGRYASLGLVLRAVSREVSADRVPSVRGAPPVPAGATRLVLDAPRAQRVTLAGDWNGWAATPATRGSDGHWYVDLRLPRGEYRYAFKVDGERWAVPDGAVTVDDGFGGRSALLTVR
jgi:hypothetical protein